jgi:hypothetical protein
MTDQEILAGWFSIQELAMTAMMFYLSIVTGFLVAAYIAGKNFTRSQSIFVSSLFAIFALFALWGSVGYFYLGAEYVALYDAPLVIQSRPLGIKPYYVIGLLEFVGIIAALKFMWDVRHSESE